MSRFRQYKNDVYGVRYLNHYIETQRGRNKTSFTVLTEDGDSGPVFATLGEAEWYLDLLMADPAEKELVHQLYAQDDFTLASLLVDYTQKKDTATPKEETAVKWLKKVRDRKLRNLPEEPVKDNT